MSLFSSSNDYFSCMTVDFPWLQTHPAFGPPSVWPTHALPRVGLKCLVSNHGQSPEVTVGSVLLKCLCAG